MPYVKAFYCRPLIHCERADRSTYFQTGTLLISITGQMGPLYAAPLGKDMEGYWSLLMSKWQSNASKQSIKQQQINKITPGILKDIYGVSHYLISALIQINFY